MIIIHADCDLQEFASELQKVFGKEGEKLKEVKLSVSGHQYSGCSVLCNLFKFVMLCAFIILEHMLKSVFT